jgi:hypothetical protein
MIRSLSWLFVFQPSCQLWADGASVKMDYALRRMPGVEIK